MDPRLDPLPLERRAAGLPRLLGHPARGVHTSAESVCQYACEQRSDCEAYNYRTLSDRCTLVGNAGATFATSGIHGALRFAGPRSGRSGETVGYTNSLGKGVVVHRASNGQIHELPLLPGGGALSADITAGAPAPALHARLTGYRRSDGLDSVVYRSGTRLIELARTDGSFHAFDLPIAAGLAPAGDPVAYRRAERPDRGGLPGPTSCRVCQR